MWRINHERCGLFYGPAAAILQIAHPRIAQGVADHSEFETDTLGRLRRTLAATNRIAFGTLAEAEQTREKLSQVHGQVRGEIPEGMEGRPRYSAFEPDLLLWVLATMIMAALQGYELVYGRLPGDRRQAFYRDMREFGTYFGLEESEGPADFTEFERYYDEMLAGPLLGSHPLCSRLARAIVHPKDSLSTTVIGAATSFLPIETLPSPVRERLDLKRSLFSRCSFSLVRSGAPSWFPRLPRSLRWYPESVERIERMKALETS